MRAEAVDLMNQDFSPKLKVKRRQGYLLFVLTLAGIASHAQPYPSRLGRFQVDQKKGCVPFTVTVTNLLAGDCTAGRPCVMDYESNNTQQQNTFTHIYSTAGTFKLSVLYQSIGADDISITVDPNPQPNFEIYACSGSKAAIKVVDNNYDQYVIDFNNDGTPEYILPYSNNILTPPHTYATPGGYTTSVRGRRLNSSDNCTAKTQPFQTLATLPTPTMNTLTSVDAATIKLDFTTADNIQYKLEIATNTSATFQLYQTLYGVKTLTIPNLKLDQNYYCFRISAFDPCNNTNTYSNIVCSSKFTATAQSDVNKLVWSTGNIPFITSYSINIKQNNATTNFTLNNSSAQNYDDTNIICITDYCYQITTNYGSGAKSISLEKCVKSFSNKIPTAINDISSAVTSAGVNLSWTQEPAFTAPKYSVFRSSNGGKYSFVTYAPSTKYTDILYTTTGKYCYQIYYTDKCGNPSPQGTTACPVELSGVLDKKNAISLVWTAYRGWKNGVKNYLLEKYNVQGVLIKSFILTDTTFLDDLPDPTNQLVRYQIKAQPNAAGLTTSVSNLIEFIKNTNIFYPTAFTPNHDNLNDGFTVSGQYIVKISLKIFDRWGSLLFTSDKNEPWDGQRDGKPMSPSVYIWKAEFTDLAGRTFSQEGTVALILN